jgi:diguanylate cyclase (GGDEF)-like protein/PAS domain S-box-containing protein
MFDIFPKDDREQSLRIKRFFMAFASYSVWGFIALLTFLLGITPVSIYVMLGCFSGILISNILIYGAIRSGFNKRFKDPSLTLPQMVIATFWTMVILYYADAARGTVLILYLVVFVFGLFKLDLWQFLYLSVFAVFNYTVVIILLHKNRPDAVINKIDILNLIILALVLPWFSFIGGYITRLKSKVARSLSIVKETELKFRTIFDSASDGITLLDIKKGKFIATNEKICNMLGYTPEEFLQLKPSDLHPKEALKLVLEKYDKVAKQEMSIARNIPLIRKNKTMFYADISGARIIMEGKEFFVSVIRDNTERRQAEKLLEESEKRYRLLADNVSDVIFTMDMNFNFTYISPSIYSATGYKTDEFLTMRLENMVEPEIFSRFLDIFNEESETEKRFDKDIRRSRALEYQHIHKDGSKFWVETTVTFLRDENNRAIGIIGSARDISRRKQVEEKLRFEEQRFRNFVEHSSDIIVLINLEGTIIYVNPAVEQVLGYKPEERIGAKGFELVHPDDIQFLTESFMTLVGNPYAPAIHGEMHLRHKNGTYRTLESVGSNLVKDHVVEAIIINYRDITERKLAEEALQKSEQRYQELSITDDLTQVYNSRHFYIQLEKEMERSNRYNQPLTLVLLDLDRFKNFNDTYGHVYGDFVLSRLGHIVKQCLRDSDSAYRYGGEEFTIILPMTTRDEGLVTAQRIQNEFRKESFSPIPGTKIFVSMSIGVSQYKPKEDMKAFVHRVDQLMYQAKKNGRDRICSE